MGVFPIPPGPMRAIEVRSSARSTICSVSSSRPKQTLGGGGGDSPGVLDVNEALDPSIAQITDLI